MNANELADWIENGAPFGKYETAKQAVVMLRQQQAEIETLQTRIVDRENEYSQIAIQNETNKALLDDANAEIEELKALLKKSAEVNRLLAEEIGYE